MGEAAVVQPSETAATPEELAALPVADERVAAMGALELAHGSLPRVLLVTNCHLDAFLVSMSDDGPEIYEYRPFYQADHFLGAWPTSVVMRFKQTAWIWSSAPRQLSWALALQGCKGDLHDKNSPVAAPDA